MNQFQESIRPEEGMLAFRESNWDLGWLVQEYHGSECDRFRNTSEHQRELWVHLKAPRTIFGAPWGTGDKFVSGLKHSTAVWAKQHSVWDCGWCVWKT
jgi:hypothetical protein